VQGGGTVGWQAPHPMAVLAVALMMNDAEDNAQMQ